MTSAELRAAFARPPAFLPTTAHYRLRLTLVLAGMFFLQLAYLLAVALIATIGWFGTRALWGAVPPNLLTATLLVGFPAASAIAVLFLLKPVLTRPPRRPKPLEILPESEPLLFEFVQRICTILDAPEPSRILVDLQVNASASIPGFLGLLRGRYDLTIGLPLAGCLALPEFAGVVAHEIGHFSQRAGLRSYFLIEGIQRWFQRVVEERDRFDAWLDRLCTKRDIRVKAVAHFAGMMVAASRKYLLFLMRIGRRISSDFSRHMEFDADRREAAVVGAEAFANTFRRLEDLNAATTVAWLWVSEGQNSGLFSDDYVELVRAGENAVADGVVSVRKKLREKSRFDTHPSDEERIAAVRAFNPLVRLELEGKAERLFQNLGAVCRQATLDAYDRIFGQSPRGRSMIPARDAMARMEETREGTAAATAILGLPVEFCARWFRLEPETTGEAAETGAGTPNRGTPKPEDFDALERRNLLQYAALRIARCGVRINPQSFELHSGDLESIRAEEAASRRKWNVLKGQLQASAWRARERLRRVRGAASTLEFETAWTTYETLSRYQAEFDEIRHLRAAEAIARENTAVFPAAACANLLEELSDSATAGIGRILADTGEIATSVVLDPRRPATFGGQLIAETEAVGEKVDIFLDRAASMASRALGQLCAAAVKAGDQEAASQTA